MIYSSRKLSEIIINTKSFFDKHGIKYNEGIYASTAPKFVESIDQDSKLKSWVVSPKGKSVIKFQLGSYSKVNHSPKANTFRCSSNGLLLLPTTNPTFQYYVELMHIRPHYEKLTSHPYMKFKVNTLSFSPSHTTPSC